MSSGFTLSIPARTLNFKNLSTLSSVRPDTINRGGKWFMSAAAAIIPENEGNESERSKATVPVRSQGGPLSFSTKYGALNPYAIYYGLVAISLGIPWFIALSACQFLYFITGGRVDKMRRLPIFFSHLWGVVLGRLTNTIPKFEGRDILKKFYKE
jgi:hypothetical protein